MTFDTKVPRQLKKIQDWFASIITRPIDEDSQMNPISPSGHPMEEEAFQYIVPSPTLRPAERIQIYNQQYWWRLLGTLHDIYPLVTRLFGYFDFNQKIAFSYLTKYPPYHWSLNFLGDRLPQWVEEEYHYDDRELVLDSTRIDWAYNDAFFVKHSKPLIVKDVEDPTKLLEKKITLQPHIHFFDLEYHLFQFRDKFLDEEPEYWVENPFPEMAQEKKYYFVLFRDLKNQIQYKELSQGEFLLLKRFQDGDTIETACQWLERQDKKVYEEASSNLHLWFQNWVIHEWLILK